MAGQPRVGPRRARADHPVGDARPGDGRPRRRASPGCARALLAVHEHAALAGLVAIAVHGITLLGDRWLHPGSGRDRGAVRDGLRPLWTGLGIIGGYLAAALGLSFYARRRIGTKRWRSLHKATILVYVLAVAHTLGAGSDAATPWLRASWCSRAPRAVPARDAVLPRREGQRRRARRTTGISAVPGAS